MESGVSKESDSVLDYPDSYLVDSGNRHLTNDEDFNNLTITDNLEVSAPNPNYDPWDAPELYDFFEEPWSSRTRKEKIIAVLTVIAKVLGALFCLYIFVCTLDTMSVSLKLMAGRKASSLFSDSNLLRNPIAGVMMGLFCTLIVQSSSTSTSVVVSMVSANLFTVREAVPIIMGANIGTSITNTFVAFTQVKDRVKFQRAFAGATIHDMFNVLTTIVLLALEVTTHYLEELTSAMLSGLGKNTKGDVHFSTLSRLTGPIVHLVVRIDKTTQECWFSPACNASDGGYNDTSMLDRSSKFHIFRKTTLRDVEVGGILFVFSILIITACLIVVVKILNSVLKGHLALAIKKVVNAKIPYCPCATGYIALFLGATLTFLLQSSSVFTSALTPMVGIGVVGLDIMYPLTLGSNVGTTGTAILAAFAVDSSKVVASLQIALCHLFFNVTGILIFYPLPFMRWPIYLAKKLGKTTAQFRWFALVYIFVLFLLVPGILLSLSAAGPYYVMTFTIILILLLAFVFILNYIQETCPYVLPPRLQNWDYLPLGLRSLQLWNDLFLRWSCCQKLQAKNMDAAEHPATSEYTRDTSQVTLYASKKKKGVMPGPKPSNISLISFSMSDDTGDHNAVKRKLSKLDKQALIEK